MLVRVLFVCTGNICRSPTAEGVFRALVDGEGLAGRIEADSAGTHGYHVGEAPDPRSQAAARRRGVDLSALRARRVRADDFARFDYLIAMDRGHRRALAAMAPPQGERRIRMMLGFAPRLALDDVPDPFYGAGDGFERVLDLIEASSAGLLDHIRRHHLSDS
jgi:protein-tyrosine phosphatase